MLVSKIRTKEDVRTCIDMYYEIADHSFVNIDKEFAYTNLLAFVREKRFVRILLDDSGSIIAWIYAQPTQPPHSPEVMLQQMYYASNKEGVMAVRCIKILHDAMVEEAKRLGISLVVSQGSHQDTSFVFTRILEKHGWSRMGYAAQLRIPRLGPERPLLATFFTR
jgi:hypothetical protein